MPWTQPPSPAAGSVHHPKYPQIKSVKQYVFHKVDGQRSEVMCAQGCPSCRNPVYPHTYNLLLFILIIQLLASDVLPGTLGPRPGRLFSIFCLPWEPSSHWVGPQIQSLRVFLCSRAKQALSCPYCNGRKPSSTRPQVAGRSEG